MYNLIFLLYFTSIGIICTEGRAQPPKSPNIPFVHHNKCTNWHRPALYARYILEQNQFSTAFVIGANVGAQNTDISWRTMTLLDKLHKVFVEPVPFFHSKLEANIKAANMTNAISINAAISSVLTELTLYCTGINEDGSIIPGFPWFVTEICSSTPERMESSYDLAANVPLELIRKHTTKYVVPAITTKELISKYSGDRPVSYVQIDVEGIDHEVLWLLLTRHCCYVCVYVCVYMPVMYYQQIRKSNTVPHVNVCMCRLS